jgi:hypothetical protein
MLLNLIVSEFEHLQAVLECCLGGFCLSEIVSDFLIRIGLFDVLVVEVDDRVAVRECLTLHTVVEDHLFLAILVNPLNFAVVSNDLLHYLGVGQCLTVVLGWELETEVVFFNLIVILLLQPIANILL